MHYFITVLARWLVIVLASASTVAAATTETGSFRADELEQTLAHALSQLGAGDMVEVVVNGPVAQHQDDLKNGDLTLSFIDFNAQTMRWEATLQVSGRTHETQTPKAIELSGRYIPLIEVPVLTKRLLSGNIIKPSDITLKPLAEHRLRHNVVFDKSTLVGKAARRVLRPGKPISLHEIEQPVIAEKGDMLQLTYRTAHMEIRTLAEALDDAALGQRIPVRNADSGATLYATVTAPGIAEVHNYMQISNNQTSNTTRHWQ